MAGYRKDYKPLTHTDAPTLRRFAQMLKQRWPNQGWLARLWCDVLAGVVWDFANQLEKEN